MNIDQFIASLVPGQPCNVSMPNHEPMIRTVKSVETRIERGSEWIYWFWESKGSTPRGTSDCGYGGAELAYHISLGDLSNA